MKKIILLILISCCFFTLTFSANSIDKAKAKILEKLGNIIRFLFSVLMILASGLFIYLGILYITGQTKIGEETVHKAILYLVLGIVLLMTSFFIPNLIKSFIESSIK
jgi:ABC-type Mn2+/Zn2+ transport system permease subunit